jgi:hypothetical protein
MSDVLKFLECHYPANLSDSGGVSSSQSSVTRPTHFDVIDSVDENIVN